MGAIATGGVRVLNEQVLYYLGISDKQVDRVAAEEQRELERREKLYRGTVEPLDVRGRTVIIVDDGLATGSTMRAAVTALKRQDPARIIVAAPVAARETCEAFKADVESTCVCVMSPDPFDGVGLWYRDFSQTTDEEVRYLLLQADSLAPPTLLLRRLVRVAIETFCLAAADDTFSFERTIPGVHNCALALAAAAAVVIDDDPIISLAELVSARRVGE